MSLQLIRLCRRAFPKNEYFSGYLAGKLQQIGTPKQVAERLVEHVRLSVSGGHRFVTPSDIIRLAVDGDEVLCLRLLHDVRQSEPSLFHAFDRCKDDLWQFAQPPLSQGTSVLPWGKVELLAQLALVSMVMLAGCPFFPRSSKKYAC